MASSFIKKTKEKLNLIIGIDTICHSIYQYAKASNIYVEDYDKNKESSYLKYWDISNLYGWAMSQKLPVNIFEWIQNISQFNDEVRKNFNEEKIKDIFLKLIFNILKNYINFMIIY